MNWWQRFLQQMRGLVSEENQEAFDDLADEMTEAAPQPGDPDDDRASADAGDVSAAVRQAVAPLQESLKGLQTALAEEREAREEAVSQLEAQQEARRDEEISETLDAAVQEGRITSEEREKWQTRLEKDFDGYAEALAERPASEAVKGSSSDSDEDGSEDGPTDPATPRSPARGGFMDYVNESQQQARA